MKTDKRLSKNKEEQYSSLFSNRLKTLRQEKQYSQKEVAEKLGVAVSTYANWEQGRRFPTVCDIFNLLAVFEIDANELFNLSD